MRSLIAIVLAVLALSSCSTLEIAIYDAKKKSLQQPQEGKNYLTND